MIRPLASQLLTGAAALKIGVATSALLGPIVIVPVPGTAPVAPNASTPTEINPPPL